jgi:23S rRNA maturation-related 3'-5' exoribonuclease YhaM
MNEKTPNKMFNELIKETKRIKDKTLRADVVRFLKLRKYKISMYPASIMNHHAEKYGLIAHTIEVCKFCEYIIEDVLSIDRETIIDSDSIYAAAILHDIGKIYNYDIIDEKRGTFAYRKERGMMDHALAVIVDYERTFKKALPIDVQLLILVHEGGWAKHGVYPDTMDAAILASADMLSSRFHRYRTWVL